MEKAQGNNSELISASDACKLLGVHPNTLYRYISAGEIPAFRMVKGSPWKIKKADLENWLEDKQAIVAGALK